MGTLNYDKDGVSALGVFYEMAAYLHREGKQLHQQLDMIYNKWVLTRSLIFGFNDEYVVFLWVLEIPVNALPILLLMIVIVYCIFCIFIVYFEASNYSCAPKRTLTLFVGE